MSKFPSVQSPLHLLFFLLLTFRMCTTTHGLPAKFSDKLKASSAIQSGQSEYEQCFYQASNAGKLLKVTYGQCMSMNGPDGCCLEGHYKPGICPNLGHLCCTKPDPDCSKMRNNKDIARVMLNQRREHFKKFTKENAEDSASTKKEHGLDWSEHHYRPPRSSNSPQIRVNFEIVEMPSYMQLDAISFVTDALDRHKGDMDEAAYYLCRMLDQKYPEKTNWGCVVGTKFDYSIEPSTGKYMLFYIGSLHRIQVMAFVPKTAN